MKKLLEIIRSRCRRGTWSRGAQLVRAGAVATMRSDDESLALRVSARDGHVAFVTLFPGKRAWHCDCGSTERICPHVAAATISLRQSRQAAGGGAGGEALGHVGYRLDRHDGHLALRRSVVFGRHETPLVGSVSELSSANGDGPKVSVTEHDRLIEENLGGAQGVIPQAAMSKMLDALADAADIQFRKSPVKIGKPTSGLCVLVEECGQGFRLRLDKDPMVNEIFANGALKRGTKIRAVVPHGLGERRFSELRGGKIFEAGELGELVGEVLPTLQLQLPVVVKTSRLPASRPVPPHLVIHTSREADTLVLLARIYYGEPPLARVDGETLTLLSGDAGPLRDAQAELELRRLTRSVGLEVGIKKAYTELQAIAASRRLAELTDPRLRLEGEAYREFYEAAALAPRLEVEKNGDFALWFEAADLAAGAEGGSSRRADAGAVIRAWEKGNALVPLLGGGFAPLPADWLHTFGHRVRDLLAAREAMAAQPDAPHAFTQLLPELTSIAESLDQPPPPAFKHLRALLEEGFAGIPKARLSAKLNKQLRDYQKAGVNWLSFLRDLELGALLADDMGLGKTVQTLCALKGRTLIVAPTSVIQNWVAEIARFRPALRPSLYHGPLRELRKSAKVTLTTYAILRLDAEQLAAEEWDIVVLDEAQAIKNSSSQVAKAAFGLKARFRIALTGTPVENRLEDIWSQFHFLNRGLLGGRQDFNDRYVRPTAAGDPEVAERLRARLKPFILRRLKSEVAKELPPRTEVVLRCELSKAERGVYDAVRAATRKDVVKKLALGKANTLAVLEALLRLRQAASHPGLLPGQKKFLGETSAKLALLMEVLGEALAEGHKALVFSQWTSMLDLVVQELDKANVPFARLDGRTRDRKKVVDRFQAPDGPAVMLISLKAGGTGLNLTAADNVFLLDPWWNPAVEDQAADRAHRIGQSRPVFVHKLVAQDTVEERILELQYRKRQLAETALGKAAAAAKQITREELLALLD
jgi:superfamily II DNA or RNA helicase